MHKLRRFNNARSTLLKAARLCGVLSLVALPLANTAESPARPIPTLEKTPALPGSWSMAAPI